MFISTRVRYAIRALIEIGLSNNNGVLLKEISKKQNLSLKYLDHIFTQLKTRGIVKKIKAKKGGYLLGRDTKDISVYDVIEAIEGIKRIECLEDKKACSRSSFCGARVVWENLDDRVNEIFKELTLKDFIDAQKRINEQNRPNMFSI